MTTFKNRKKYVNVKRYRDKNLLEEKCVICGKKLEEGNFNSRCIPCTRWNQVRAIAYRSLMKDFK